MRIKSHKGLYFKICKFIFIIITTVCIVPKGAFANTNDENIQKIFSLARGVGTSYYHLTDLCDKAKFKPYSVLKDEYSDAFQNLNLLDIISDDMNMNTNSRLLLKKIRFDLYNALRDQDLNEIALLRIRNSYVLYYETLANEIQKKYSAEGSWLFVLGFYSSFQSESLNSRSGSKVLLSGFNKILCFNPFSNLPDTVINNLKTINELDKNRISNEELVRLKQNITCVIEYFSSYPDNKKLSCEIKELSGSWQGILIDPDNQRHKICLIVKDDKNIKMNIDGIAQNITVSDAKIINNYFTFMFKPFGNEKLFIKFNARISDNTFTGEVVDTLGQKGNWLLSRNISETKN